jgi:hypothetical protein
MAPIGEQHPFGWAGSPVADPAVRAALSGRVVRRRRLWLAGVCAFAAAAAAIVVVTTSGGGAGGGRLPTTPVSLAAEVTTSQAGFRFTLAIAASAGGRTLDTTASGVIDERPALTGSMAVNAESGAFRELFVGPSIYMALPNAPTPWVRVDLASYEHALGVTAIGGDDPSQALDFLRAAAIVTDLGPQTIDGVRTTHYHAVVNLERYAAEVAPSLRVAAQQNADELEHLTGATQYPVDAWVDAQNRVRQLELSPPPICSTSGPVRTTTTVEYYDYGPQAPVAAPSSSSVTDWTAQLVSLATRSLSQFGC